MLEAYLPLEPLGRGATGIVFLAKSLKQQQAQEKQDQKPPLFFAVKASKISQAHDLQRARNEERILGQLSLTPHPFLPRLHSAFDHANFRFLVLDFCSGGNLYSLQHSLPDKRFSSAAIRFYAAEILLALEHLHRLGIVYRDLKPENILLSADGHIMLTDFDLSIMLPSKDMPSVLISHGPEEQQDINHEGDDDKLPFTCFGRCASVRGGASALLHTRSRHRVMPTTASGKDARTSSSSSSMMPRLHSFVGTEEYIAPEVIRGTGHDFSVDWWALGVLLFEMAHASTPFSGATSKETFVNVLREEPIFPGLTSESALSDLIRSLLAKDPLRRLGTQGGAAEIKSHPFFSGLFWDALQDVCRPPHIPPCMLAKLESVSEGFDLLSHLEQVECTRIEARAKRKLERKQTADCQ